MTGGSVRSGLMTSKEEVRGFLNNASDYALKKFLLAGMPVRIEGGKWLAHKENIEDFFKHYTRTKAKLDDNGGTDGSDGSDGSDN